MVLGCQHYLLSPIHLCYFSPAVVQGDFLTSYIASLGNFGFLNRGDGRRSGIGNVVNNLLSTLRNRIDFNPGDDDDIVMPTQGNQNGNGGFSVRGLLGNLVSSIATATAEQFAGPGNAAGRQCIRQIVVVSTFFTISLSQILR